MGLHLQKCFENLGYQYGNFPITEKATQTTLALPMFPELNKYEQEYVVKKNKAVLFKLIILIKLNKGGKSNGFIRKKIQNKTAKIGGVIGLGYVGLPLAVEKAKAGYTVLGFDVQKEKVDKVNQGINYIGDVVTAELEDLVRDGKLSATTDYDRIKECDAIMICVPTPLNKYKQPDLSFVINSTNEVAKRMKKKIR